MTAKEAEAAAVFLTAPLRAGSKGRFPGRPASVSAKKRPLHSFFRSGGE